MEESSLDCQRIVDKIPDIYQNPLAKSALKRIFLSILKIMNQPLRAVPKKTTIHTINNKISKILEKHPRRCQPPPKPQTWACSFTGKERHHRNGHLLLLLNPWLIVETFCLIECFFANWKDLFPLWFWHFRWGHKVCF